MPTLETHIRIAGLLQFVILVASAHVPIALDWRCELAKLSPFLRRLFWVYGVFIVLSIVGMALLCSLYSGELAGGAIQNGASSPARSWDLPRALCAFIAVFWSARLAVQLFVFDAKPILTTRYLRTGYHGLTLIFVYLSAVFIAAVLKTGE